MIGGTQDPMYDTVSSGDTYCSSLFGGGNPGPDAARATGLFPYASNVSMFTNYLPYPQTGGGAATFTLLINGSASILCTSAGAGDCGYFIDSSHVVAVAVNDTCANQIAVTSGTGTYITWSGAGLLLQSTE